MNTIERISDDILKEMNFLYYPSSDYSDEEWYKVIPIKDYDETRTIEIVLMKCEGESYSVHFEGSKWPIRISEKYQLFGILELLGHNPFKG